MVEMTIGGKTVSESEYGAFEIGTTYYTEDEFEELQEFFESDPGNGDSVTVGEGPHPVALFSRSTVEEEYFVLNSELHYPVVAAEEEWAEFFDRFDEQSFVGYIEDTYDCNIDKYDTWYLVDENTVECRGYNYIDIRKFVSDESVKVTYTKRDEDEVGEYVAIGLVDNR